MSQPLCISVYYFGNTNRFGVRTLTLMTIEKEKQIQLSDYKKLVRKIIREGSLFSLFKFQTEMIRELTVDDGSDFTQQKIVDFLSIIKG